MDIVDTFCSKKENSEMLKKKITSYLPTYNTHNTIGDINELDVIYEVGFILNEDKKYFPEMEEVYPGAETLVNEEDT